MTDYTIKRYNKQREKYKNIIEDFRIRSLDEGSDLTYENYDPDYADLETWMVFYDNQLIAISCVESSHYTDDPHISARICKDYILNDWDFLDYHSLVIASQIEWAQNDGFQILYRTSPYKNKQYKHLILEHHITFTEFEEYQYVYTKKLNDELFVWKPKQIEGYKL